MKRLTGVLVWSIATTIVLLLAGCGDDDNPVSTGGGGTPTMVSGTFMAVGLNDDPYSAVFSISLNGSGTGIYNLIRDSAGEAGASDAFSYTQEADGRMNITSDDSHHGVVSLDESVLAFNFTSPGCEAGMDVLVRAGSGMEAGSFSGQYQGVGMEYSGSGPLNAESYVVTMNSAGNGSVRVDFPEHSDPTMEGADLSYQVGSDGSFTLVAPDLIRGFLAGDGGMLVFSHLESPEIMTLNILFRVASGMSNASLTGDYIYIWFSESGESLYGEINFNGAGTAFFKDLFSNSGRLENGSFPYSVNSAGKILLNGEDTGFVRQDGQVGIAVSMGTEKHMVMFIREH